MTERLVRAMGHLVFDVVAGIALVAVGLGFVALLVVNAIEAYEERRRRR